MISRYLPNYEFFWEPVRELVLRQMPFGEISDLPTKRWMLQGSYYTEVHNGIRKLNVTETQLAAELIYQINDSKVNNYVSGCVMWLEKHRDSQSLFPIWVPSYFVSPFSHIRNVEQRANLRCTAQKDLGKLLIQRIDDEFKDSFKKILNSQIQHSGAWAEGVDGSASENVFATANAALLIFLVSKYSLQNNKYGKRLRCLFGDIIQPLRYSWMNGARWFHQKKDANGMLKVETWPLFTTASSYLTLYPLLHHHDKELPLGCRTLDKAVDHLLKSEEGIWQDRSPNGKLERYNQKLWIGE